MKSILFTNGGKAVRSNAIHFLHENQFEKLNHFRYFDFTHNPIQSVSTSSFTGLYTLESLFVNYTHISRLHDKVFSSLHNVHTINLVKNKIISIEKNTFSNVSQLRYLLIFGNPIKSFHIGFSLHLEKLISFDSDVKEFYYYVLTRYTDMGFQCSFKM